MKNRNLAAGFTDQIHHRVTSQPTALQIVRRDVTNDFAFVANVSKIVCENGDASVIGLFDCRADGRLVAGINHDRRHALYDKVVDLIRLFFNVCFAGNSQQLITMRLCLGLHRISNDFEERIGKCQCRITNRAFRLACFTIAT